jgi:hypothetical protein
MSAAQPLHGLAEKPEEEDEEGSRPAVIPPRPRTPAVTPDPISITRNDRDEDAGDGAGGAGPPSPPNAAGGGSGGSGSEPEPDGGRFVQRTIPVLFVGGPAFEVLAEAEGAPPGMLNLVASNVVAMDALGAVSLSAAMRRHLAAEPDNRVMIWDPADPSAQGLVWNLMGIRLPDGAEWSGDYRAGAKFGVRVPGVMFPALVCDSARFRHDLEHERHFLAPIAAAGGVPHDVAQRLRSLYAELAGNARDHGNDLPIIALSRNPETDEITFAVWDGGPGLSEAEEPAGLLRSAVVGTRLDMLGLKQLPMIAGCSGWGVKIDIASATARAQYLGGTWAVREADTTVPGFAVGVTLAPTS